MSVNTFDKNFLDKIISMYARGMTVREIQSHIEEIYGHHNKALLKDKKASVISYTLECGMLFALIKFD